MNENSSPAQILITTLPEMEQAKQMAQTIVNQKLAACINILPQMVSIYRWQGALEEGTEHMLVIKTEVARLDELKKTILEMHPYELPEIIVVPIVGGHPPYLDWIGESVQE